MRAETHYLLELARAWAHGRPQPVAAPDDLDRDRFVHLLGNQPSLPTLAPWVDPESVPQQERAQLAQAAEISRRRTTVMLLELERVLPSLAECGCRPVVFKGASLALTVYDRPEDRWFVDLDLLIDPGKLTEAYAALQRLDYRFASTINPVRYYEDHHFHRILVSNQGVTIEVHWALTMPASVYTFDLAAMRRGCLEIPLGMSGFLAPAVTDQILHGVLQSVAGGYGDLRRILDLHLLDARLDGEQRRLLAARAWSSNLATGLWLQYRLREELLEAPTPPEIEAACRPTPRLVRLLDGLQVAENCLLRRAGHVEGYDYLLHCLCTPVGRRGGEMLRFIFPDERGRMEAGLGRDEGPVPAWKRARLHLSRLRASARLLALVTRASLASGR